MSLSVSVVLLKSRKAIKGFPIKMRVTYNQKSNYLGLNMYLDEVDFNKVMKSKRLNPKQKQIKNQLLEHESKALKIIKMLPVFTFKEFKLLFTGKLPDNIGNMQYCFDKYITELNRKKKLKTASMYSTVKRSLLTFQPNLLINDITPELLEAYCKYLREEKLNDTSISIYMRMLRAIVNKNKNLIYHYPFEHFKIPRSLDNKRAISKPDLLKLLNYKFENPTDEKYFDLFKFSFYAAGMNIKDILLLKPECLQNGFLIYNRSKTNKTVKIYLLKEALEIIKKYSNSKTEFLFPFLKNEEPEYLVHRVHAIVRRVNVRIKKACFKLNLPVVTSYSARHSFATVMMNNGANIALISQMLGHTSIQTTQKYLGAFTDTKLAEGMKLLI